MQIGLLTAPFRDTRLESIVQFASDEGFDALEVATGPGAHIDPADIDDERADQIRSFLTSAEVSISSLAQYTNVTDADPAKRREASANLIAAIDAAARLDVPIVCALAGMPVPGKNRMQTIEEDMAEVYRPIIKHAADKGIKIALENWHATNIMNLVHWERVFEILPDKNFGLNFDPSHLLWQGIDYIEAVDRFADRIFHTHAKDTEIKDHVLRRVGNQERGWWRYVIPGYGRVRWGEYIAALKSTGFDGVLSIEHEDRTLGVEAGFIKGRDFLRPFV